MSNLELEIQSWTAELSYNLHRRTLPVGKDGIVLFNLPWHEAQKAAKCFKTHIKNNRVVYYELVPADADAVRRNPYWNEPNFLKREADL